MLSAPVGLILGSHIPPKQIPQLSLRAERLGYRELWLTEDYFFTGGIAGALAALDATSSIPVGLGVVSVMVRHPALLAMEIATAADLHPGRIAAGVGLGTTHWIRQMGLHPKSALSAMREAVTTLRSLLAGEQVTLDGSVFHCDAIVLEHPPEQGVPIYLGAIGPKMLRLGGEIADGTLASGLASVQYLRWLRERIAEGRARSHNDGDHRVVPFVIYCVDEDGRLAKQMLREITAFYLAMPINALTEVYGIADELSDMQVRGGKDAAALIAREMPDQWMDDLVVAGDPDECAAKIQRLIDGGSDSVALFPAPVDRTQEMVEMTARDVLPKLS